MKSTIAIGDKALLTLADGVNAITEVVKKTAGAAGRLTVIDYDGFDTPHITKDGFLSGNSIFLEDRSAQAGVRLVKNACEKTVEDTGDGSTATAVLIQAIVNKGIDVIGDEDNINMVARGIVDAKNMIVKSLEKNSIPVAYGSNELRDIAIISANNDKKIGELVAGAISDAGEYGRVMVEESNSVYTTVEQSPGFVLDGGGLLSSYFINDAKHNTNELINPLVLVTNHKMEDVKDMMTIITIAHKEQRPLLIIGQEIQGEFLSTAIINFVQGKLKINCIELPTYGDNTKALLGDIAAKVGATFVNFEGGTSLGEVTLDMLGSCGKSVTDRDETRIIDGDTDADEVLEIMNNINERLKNKELDLGTKEFLEGRLASLSTGLTTIFVGAQTKVEAAEMRDRIDDCLGSCKVSISGGASIGGGVALYSNSFGELPLWVTEDKELGIGILFEAIKEPAITILSNAGLPRDEALNILNDLENNDIYNVMSYKVEDAYKSGIVDATKVITVALENAVSTAVTILKTSSLVINTK